VAVALAGVLFLVGAVFLVRAVHPSCRELYRPQLEQMRAQTDPLFADQAEHITARVECGRFDMTDLRYTVPFTPRQELTETLQRAGWTRTEGLMTSPNGAASLHYYKSPREGASGPVSIVAVSYAGSGSHLARNLLTAMALCLAVILLVWSAFRTSRRRARRRSAAKWGVS
jgi:hypothetical protein